MSQTCHWTLDAEKVNHWHWQIMAWYVIYDTLRISISSSMTFRIPHLLFQWHHSLYDWIQNLRKAMCTSWLIPDDNKLSKSPQIYSYQSVAASGMQWQQRIESYSIENLLAINSLVMIVLVVGLVTGGQYGCSSLPRYQPYIEWKILSKFWHFFFVIQTDSRVLFQKSMSILTISN